MSDDDDIFDGLLDEAEPDSNGDNTDSAGTTDDGGGTDMMAEMAAAMAEQGISAEEIESNMQQNAPQPDFDALTADDDDDVPQSSSASSIANGVGSGEVNIETLLKVPVELSIEVGRTKMKLDNLLETQEGTVIELDRLLDDPLDILVNGALIAHGVVVLANERFGIQITDIISLEERAKSL